MGDGKLLLLFQVTYATCTLGESLELQLIDT